MYFWTYGLRNTWLDKCLKSPLSDNPSTSNMLNGPKLCSKLNDRTFTMFIDSRDSNSGWKSLSELYGKSWDSFLTHWMSMTSILFWKYAFVVTFSDAFISETKTFFSFFLFLFLFFVFCFFVFFKFRFNFKHFQKNMILIAAAFLNLRTMRNMVR